MAIVIAQKKLYRFISIMIPDEKLYVENEKKNTKRKRWNVESIEGNFKVTLTQICKSSNIFVFIWK